MSDTPLLPAYGGPGWRPRSAPLRLELGRHWSPCGVDTEWRPLKAVLLHRPGAELEAVASEPEAHLLRSAPDPEGCRAQHDELARIYREEGVAVHYVNPPPSPLPTSSSWRTSWS